MGVILGGGFDLSHYEVILSGLEAGADVVIFSSNVGLPIVEGQQKQRVVQECFFFVKPEELIARFKKSRKVKNGEVVGHPEIAMFCWADMNYHSVKRERVFKRLMASK
jgi:hypothetical protein